MTKQKTAVLCPNCRKLVGYDEKLCPHCHTQYPTSWWKNNFMTRGMANAKSLTKTIIFLNIGMFILSLVLKPSLSSLSLDPFQTLSPSGQSLLLLGSTGTLPIDKLHRWWTLVSANYLHGGLLHILFNMLALWQIAPFICREYGQYRMIIIYTMRGVLGFYISCLAGIAQTIGASAALCGLIGAALYYGKSRGGTYGQAVYRQLSGWTIGIFLFGFLVPGINNWGHGGGLVGGAVSGLILGYREKKTGKSFS